MAQKHRVGLAMRALIVIAGIAVLGLLLGRHFRVPMLLSVSGLQAAAFVYAGTFLDWTGAETAAWTILSIVELQATYLAGLVLFRSSRTGGGTS